MDHSLSREGRVALDAVRAAAKICRAVQRQIDDQALEKQDKSPVTIADFASQAVVCRILHDSFPNDPIIAEEDAAELRRPENEGFLEAVRREVAAGYVDVSAETLCEWIDGGGASDYSDRFWTLDPIDGTKGFLRKEQYAISLALVIDGEIQVAALACPNLLNPRAGADVGSVLTAIRGQGAFRLSLEPNNTQAVPIHVSQTSDSRQIRICESVESRHSDQSASSVIARELGITAEPVRLDSQAKYAVVASGDAEAYLRLPTKADYRERIWDHAGGVLVVEEAGGRVTDVDGRKLEFTHGDKLQANRGVIVTNGLVHDRVLAAVRAAGVSG